MYDDIRRRRGYRNGFVGIGEYLTDKIHVTIEIRDTQLIVCAITLDNSSGQNTDLTIYLSGVSTGCNVLTKYVQFDIGIVRVDGVGNGQSGG